MGEIQGFNALRSANMIVEYHHFQWKNQLEVAMFHSYVKSPKGQSWFLHMFQVCTEGDIHDMKLDPPIYTNLSSAVLGLN